jgi:hypothetical protein
MPLESVTERLISADDHVRRTGTERSTEHDGGERRKDDEQEDAQRHREASSEDGQDR